MVTTRSPAAAGGSASFTRCFSSCGRALRRAGAGLVDRDGLVPVVLPAGPRSNRVVTGSTPEEVGRRRGRRGWATVNGRNSARGVVVAGVGRGGARGPSSRTRVPARQCGGVGGRAKPGHRAVRDQARRR